MFYIFNIFFLFNNKPLIHLCGLPTHHHTCYILHTSMHRAIVNKWSQMSVRFSHVEKDQQNKDSNLFLCIWDSLCYYIVILKSQSIFNQNTSIVYQHLQTSMIPLILFGTENIITSNSVFDCLFYSK